MADVQYNGGNPLALPQGTLIYNRYRIGSVLGAGGFGITYLAEDVLNHIPCAVKEYVPLGICGREYGSLDVYVLSKEKQDDFSHGMKRFLEEAAVLIELQHIPNVVHITDYFDLNSTAYYVMEYLDGMTVKQLVKRMPDKRIDVKEAVEIIAKVGNSLDRIHKERHLLHRDISPDNIIYTKNNEIKLIDFGSAKHLSQGEKNVFSIVLKPGFAPPEQYSMEKPQGNYTDEYALASSFYYMVTGKMPTDAMERMTGQELEPAFKYNSQVTIQMWQVLSRAMSLDYRTRYPSVYLFVQELCQAYNESVYRTEMPEKDNSYRKGEGSVDTYQRPYVQVLNGANKGKQWYMVSNSEIKIGRGSQSGIILNECPNVSKVHCILMFDAESKAFYIQDLSTNGIRIGKNILQKDKVYQISKNTKIILAESIELLVGVEDVG